MKWYKGLENRFAQLMHTSICTVNNRLINDTERHTNTFKLNKKKYILYEYIMNAIIYRQITSYNKVDSKQLNNVSRINCSEHMPKVKNCVKSRAGFHGFQINKRYIRLVYNKEFTSTFYLVLPCCSSELK